MLGRGRVRRLHVRLNGAQRAAIDVHAVAAEAESDARQESVTMRRDWVARSRVVAPLNRQVLREIDHVELHRAGLVLSAAQTIGR